MSGRARGRTSNAWRGGSCPGLLAILLLLSSALPGLSHAHNVPLSMEYQVKAAFLYKFGQYVTWPETAFDDNDSPVVIGIAGPERFIRLVRKATRDRTIQNRPVEVRRLTGELPEDLHLLFVSRDEERRLPRLRAAVKGQPTLIVTESESGLDSGGVIDFHIEDDRVRFDVNLNVAGQQGLWLSAQLLKIARRIRGTQS